MGNLFDTPKAITNMSLPSLNLKGLHIPSINLPEFELKSSNFQKIFKEVAAAQIVGVAERLTSDLIERTPEPAKQMFENNKDLVRETVAQMLEWIIPVAARFGAKAVPYVLQRVGQAIPVAGTGVTVVADVITEVSPRIIKFIDEMNSAVVAEMEKRGGEDRSCECGAYENALEHYGSGLPLIAVAAGRHGGDPIDTTPLVTIADLTKYTDTANAVTKDKIVEDLIRALESLGLRAEGTDRLSKIKSIMEKIPSGDRFKPNEESHKRVCAKIAEALNNAYGSQIVDPALDPAIVCKQVYEVVSSLASGMHSEFLSVYDEVKRALNNVNILDATINENLGGIKEKIATSDDSLLAARTAVNFDIHKLLDDEKVRQLSMLKNLLNVNLLPTERDITLLLKSIDDNGAKHLMSVEWKPGQNDFGKLIEATIKGMALTASFAELINNALKKIGKTVDQYAAEKDPEKFLIEMTDQLLARMDAPQKEKEELMDAIKLLYKNFYRNTDIANYMHRKGSYSTDNIDTMYGGVDRERYPRSAIDKRVRSMKALRHLVFNAFYKRVSEIFKSLVASLDIISKKVGSEIPLSDKLDDFRHIIQRMREQLVENKNIYYALIGYYNDALSKQKRETLLGDLKMISSYVDAILEMDIYKASSGYFRDFQNAIKAMVEIIEKYSNEMASKFGRGEGENADPAHQCQYLDAADLAKEGSGPFEDDEDDDDDPNNPFNMEPVQIKRTSRTIYDAFRQFDYYYRVAQIKENLAATSREISHYGEKYDQLVAASVASVLRDEQGKYEAAREYLENMSLDDFAKKGADRKPWSDVDLSLPAIAAEQKKAALKILDDQWNARKRFWATVEAVDSYMRMFHDGLVKDPNSIRDIKAMLDDIEVLTETYSNSTGEKLSLMFELFPTSVINYTSERSGLRDDINNENFEGHYYDKVGKMHEVNANAKPGNPYLITDPVSGAKARLYAKQIISSLGMLKNFMSVFIYVGNKFSTGKSPNDVGNQIFMTPVQIYNNIVEYITASAFAQGFGSDSDKISKKDSSGKFIIPDTWNKPDNSSKFGIGFSANIGSLVGSHKFKSIIPIDNAFDEYMKVIKDYTDGVKYIDELIGNSLGPINNAIKQLEQDITNIENNVYDEMANDNQRLGVYKNLMYSLLKTQLLVLRGESFNLNKIEGRINAAADILSENELNKINKMLNSLVAMQNRISVERSRRGEVVETTAEREREKEKEKEKEKEAIPEGVREGTGRELNMTSDSGRSGGVPPTSLSDAIIKLINYLKRASNIDYIDGVEIYRPDGIPHQAKSSFDNFSIAGATTNNWFPQEKSTHFNFKRLFGVWMRSTNEELSKYELVSFAREDEHFVMLMKALAAKVFTVTGMYDVLDRPHEINSISPIRMIVGGDEGVPKVEPGAAELYLRLPLLAQFYRDLFKFDGDDKSYYNDLTGLPRRDNLLLKISMVPEVEGVFSGLIKFIFRRTKDVYETAYTDDEMKQLISEINIIYQRMQPKHGQKVVMETIRELVDEVNRRYAIVTKADHDKYVSEIDAYEYNYGDLNREAPEYDQYGRPIDVDIAILPGEGDMQIVRQSPAERLLSTTIKRRDPLAGHKLDDGYYKLLYRFRCCIDKLFEDADIGHEYTFKNAIKSAQIRLRNAQSDLEKYKIIASLVRGVDIYSKVEGLKYLLFHETVVVGLNTLSGLHTLLQSFRDQSMLIDLHKYQEIFFKHADESATVRFESFVNAVEKHFIGTATESGEKMELSNNLITLYIGNVFGKCMNSIHNGGDDAMAMENEFVFKKINGWTSNNDRKNGIISIAPVQQSSMRTRKGEKLCQTVQDGFISILSGGTIEQYKQAITSDKHNLEARDRILAFFRACFDREYVMKMLVQLVFGLCGDSQSLAEFRIEDGQLFIDTTGVKKLVEDLFVDVSYFIDSLRPFVPQDVMDKYTSKINPGSYYWLQEQIIEKIIKGRPPQSGVAAPKKGYVSIDEACRKLSRTYDILTLKYNYDMSVFNSPVGLKPTAKRISQTHYDKVFAEMIFYNAAIPNSGLAVSSLAPLINRGIAINPPDIVDFKGQTVPLEALHVSGYAANKTIDTRFIARFKQLYTFDENITLNRSALFMFNQLIAKYIRQVYDVATQKVYINTINNFVNNVFNQSVTDFMYTYPDISPMVFSKYEDALSEKIDSRKLLERYNTLPSFSENYINILKDAVSRIKKTLDNYKTNEKTLLTSTGDSVPGISIILGQSILAVVIEKLQNYRAVKDIGNFLVRYGFDGADYNFVVNYMDEMSPADALAFIQSVFNDLSITAYNLKDDENVSIIVNDYANVGRDILGSVRDTVKYANIPVIALQLALGAVNSDNSIEDMWILCILRIAEYYKNGGTSVEEARKHVSSILYSVPTIYKKAGEPLVDVTVKYDDAITADTAGNNYFGSKTSGQLKFPDSDSEKAKLLLKGIPIVKQTLFGERMDPDSLHVLFTSLSVILKNIISSKNPTNQQFVYITESISDVPIYMKEKYRSQLPLFRLYFKNLIGLCDTIRKFISAREVNLNRTEWGMTVSRAAPSVNPWPYVLMKSDTDCETTRARYSGILDSITKGCNSLIACCDQVVRETGDEPKYLEVASGSIRDYKNQYGTEPFMPISSALYVLRNITSESASDFLPVHAFGSEQFKWQYGNRLLLAQPHVAFNPDHSPGHKQLVESYNSLLETRSYVDIKRADSYLKNVVKSLRFIFELKHIKGLLTSYVKNEVDASVNTQGLYHDTNGLPRRNVLVEGNFVRGDMVLGVYKYNSHDPRVSGPDTDYNSIEYAITNNPKMPLSIVDTVRLTLPDNVKQAQLQKRLTPAYSITHALQQIMNLTESGMREDRVRDLIKYITGVCDDKRSLVIQNIIDLNIIPINVHALMREIPLANLYNYAYTFDRLVIELYYGLQNDNARKLISELCRDVYDPDGTLSSLSHARTAKDMLVSLLIRPYMGTMAGDNYHYELTKDMLAGVSGNELGRPKFLSDQVYGKAIFGELYENYNTYSEMGPSAGHVANKVITLNLMKEILIRIINNAIPASFNNNDVVKAVGMLLNGKIHKPDDLSGTLQLMAGSHYTDISLLHNFVYDAYIVLRKLLSIGSLYKEDIVGTFKDSLLHLNARYALFIDNLKRVNNLINISYSKRKANYDTSDHANNTLHYLDITNSRDEDRYGATLEPDNENVYNNDQVHEVKIDDELKAYLVAVGKMRFNTKYIRNLIFIVNLYRSVRLKLQRDLVYNKEIIARSSSITDPSITEFRGNSVYTPRRPYGTGKGQRRYGENTYEKYEY
jgi:hypothetical protein